MTEYYCLVPNANTPTWFKEGAAEFVHGGDERLKASLASGKTAEDLINGIKGGSWTGSSDDYAGAYLAVRHLDNRLQGNGSDFATFMGTLAGTDIDTSFNTITSEGSSEDMLDSLATSLVGVASADYAGLTAAVSGVILEVGAETDTGSAGGSDAGGGGAQNAEDVVAYSGTTNDQPLSGFSLEWDASEPLTLQIGANNSENDQLELTYGSVNAQSLGIEGISIGSAAGAQGAIGQFDSAIESLSSSRSDIGSFVNRLEHTVNNLITSETNQQAAESQIRDVDFASATADFTKQQILSQASNSMLAQANQQRNAILSLLQ